MPVWLIFIAVSLYILTLFVVAWRGDRDQTAGRTLYGGGLIYALALGVYCTSWTYFGAVGTAASSGFDYIWILVGPAIVFLCLPHLVRRIGDISQREGITTLSDFLSARYGKSRGVAVLATTAAVAGSLPYIALQLKSVGSSLMAMTEDGSSLSTGYETVLLTSAAMAVFAIIFGTRQSDVTKHNPGIMRVLAYEAVIKLAALSGVAILSWIAMMDASVSVPKAVISHFGDYSISGRAISILLLSVGAVICLPRQFHVAMIERQNASNIIWAKWVFPAYLLITSLVVIPITCAGLTLLPDSTTPDLFVIQLPLMNGDGLLALFVFLGGFSAATGMVIVSTLTLSTMVTNDIIVPSFMRDGNLERVDGQGGSRLILIRRLVIVGLMALAFGYYRLAGNSAALAQIGLLSFAAAIQFGPALIGGIYWRGGRKNGALAGLGLGLGMWIYTLFFPALIGIESLSGFLPDMLNPHALLGYDFKDSLTHGVFWSLSLNIAGYIIFSLLSTERLRDRVQAAAFTLQDEKKMSTSVSRATGLSTISPDGLRVLAARFLAPEAVEHSFAIFKFETGIKTQGNMPADWTMVQHTEKLLTRAIGASSARVIMSSAIGGVDVDLDDVLTIFDQTSQSDRFDQHMLQATLENIHQGISVVDHNQNLVAWNGAYVDLFNYPPELLRVGVPVQNLIEYNISSGWIDSEKNTSAAQKRVSFMQAGSPHSYERQNHDGRYIRIIGNPMPGGGYVTSFTDITADKARETALLDSKDALEMRVQKRTEDLIRVNTDLEAARAEAVGANASKTRFLAAASHDLLQPLNAARLFLGAVDSDKKSDGLINKADKAIQSADELLKGLLNISRLDHSNVTAKVERFALEPLFDTLVNEAMPMARAAGLKLRYVPTRVHVLADQDFLKSILRNLLSNARRYTQTGGIVIGARREGKAVRIEVWDSGPGISKAQQPNIFEEFQRYNDVDNLGVRGAGLGLSIVRRLAELMGASVSVRSVVGRGSVFSITLPRAKGHQAPSTIVQDDAISPPADLLGLRILCVDDEPTILEAMSALLSSWGCEVLTAVNMQQALSLAEDNVIDILIADYRLDGNETGIDVIKALRRSLVDPRNVCLLTAQDSEAVAKQAKQNHIHIIAKPAHPDKIYNFLRTRIIVQHAAQ